jgi:hypothetical protein
MPALDGAAKGGGVVRLAKILTLDSWSASVVVATVAAVTAMASTAAVSALASDEATLSASVYARHEAAHGGKRCERAVTDLRLVEPFPDTCVVRQTPVEDAAKLRNLRALRELYRLRLARPLEETAEIPEDFI